MYTNSQEIGKSNNNKSLLWPNNTTLSKHFKNPITNEDRGKIDKPIKHIPEPHLPVFDTDTSEKRDELDYFGQSYKFRVQR
jgi:hypothetical protein